MNTNLDSIFSEFQQTNLDKVSTEPLVRGFSPKDTDSGRRWTDFLLRAAILSRSLWSKDVVTPISSSADLVQCEQLLMREYHKRNLCDSNASHRYFSPHTYLRSTTMLTARRKGKLLGTISAIDDSDLGLPMDSLYHDSLSEFRNSGMKLIEFGALALDNSMFKRKAYSLKSSKKLITLANLFTGAINYVYQFTDATHVVVVVNPRHADIYRYIGMEQFGEVRHYPKVNKPAVPFILDVERFFSAAHEHVPSLFASSCMRVLQRRRRYTPTTLDLMQRIFEDVGCAIALSAEERVALAESHPLAQPILNELNRDSKTSTALDAVKSTLGTSLAHRDINEPDAASYGCAPSSS